MSIAICTIIVAAAETAVFEYFRSSKSFSPKSTPSMPKKILKSFLPNSSIYVVIVVPYFLKYLQGAFYAVSKNAININIYD